MIVLGGMIDSLVSVARNEVALNEAAERLTEAAALARRYPGARIVVSGGDGSLVYRSTDEAGIAKRFLTQIGIDPARITLETQSRNTWQNAVFTKKLIAPKPGERWLLDHIGLSHAARHGLLSRRRLRCHRLAGRFPHARAGGSAAISVGRVCRLERYRPGGERVAMSPIG